MIVLVPAYEPDGRLVDLVRDLAPHAPRCTFSSSTTAAARRSAEVFDATAAPVPSWFATRPTAARVAP